MGHCFQCQGRVLAWRKWHSSCLFGCWFIRPLRPLGVNDHDLTNEADCNTKIYPVKIKLGTPTRGGYLILKTCDLILKKRPPLGGSIRRDKMQLQVAKSVYRSLENCLVICVSLRVEAGGGPKCGKGGLGVWGQGSLENCKCHTRHVYRYY